MDNTILSLDELKSRITSFYQEKKAAHMPPEKDPQETTPPTPEKDDGDDASKMVLPNESLSVTNTNDQAENNIPGMQSGEASGSAPGTTETVDGSFDKQKQKQDESVDDPVTAKVAADGLTLAERIRQRLMGKQAGEQPQQEQPQQEQPQQEQPQQEQPKAAGQQVAAEAVASDFDMNPNAYKKIAGLVLGYEEGRQLLDQLADREMGKQAAHQLIAEAEQLGAQEAYQNQQEAEFNNYVNQLASTATQEDVSDMRKMASVHNSAINALEHDFEKSAYDAGAEQAAAAMDEGDGAIPGDVGGDVSIDEIAEVVMAMVESGELDPQLAEQILAELAQADQMAAGGGGMPGGEEEALAAAAAGGMGGEMGGEEIPPEAMAAMAEEPKMAAVANTCKELTKTAASVDQIFNS